MLVFLCINSYRLSVQSSSSDSPSLNDNIRQTRNISQIVIYCYCCYRLLPYTSSHKYEAFQLSRFGIFHGGTGKLLAGSRR